MTCLNFAPSRSMSMFRARTNLRSLAAMTRLLPVSPVGAMKQECPTDQVEKMQEDGKGRRGGERNRGRGLSRADV